MRKSAVYCFTEYEKYSVTYIESLISIGAELFQKGLCEKDGDTIIFKFVGITITNNEFIAVFPKGYQVINDVYIQKNHILTLINVLIRYCSEKSLIQDESPFLTGVEGKFQQISGMFWLIEDYFENGIIQRNQYKYLVNGSGNVHWSRTIKQQQPFLVQGRPAYLELITRTSLTSNDALTLIHQYIVQESFKKIGWLLGYDLEDWEIENPFEVDQTLSILDAAIQQTFIDREINLITKMKEYILGSNNESSDSHFIFATLYFQWIWEHMCSSLFTNYQEETLQTPNPYWVVNNKKAHTAQIPDILFRKDNTVYILDAKYYSINAAPFKLPGWGDLVKQFFYYHTLKQNKDFANHHFSNAFLFPGNIIGDISYLGYASVENINDLGRVHGFVISIINSMELYVQRKSGILQETLIKKLKELN